MKQDAIILFVCEHGAAKSILAATYFNKLAIEKRLPIRAMARGTHPDPELSPATIAGLDADGLTPVDSRPTLLSLDDLQNTQAIIAFCDLPLEYLSGVAVEEWLDVPPVSADYACARDVILSHLHSLLTKMDGGEDV
jgi:protein-tyrosine-phosphatase